MMYGWRARIGHVSPAILDTSAEECRKLLPPGVLHVGLSISMPIQRLSQEQVDRAFSMLVEAARRLADEEADVIISGGGPVTAGRGPTVDEQLLEAMRNATGRPCVTANRAVVDSLHLLKMRRIALVSPFVEARNNEIGAYMAACGVEVVQYRGLGLARNIDIARQPSWVPYQMARDLVRQAPDVDGVYIACPRWPVVDIIEALEADTRKPVVAAAAAMMWAGMRLLGIGDPPRGYGRLIESLRS